MAMRSVLLAIACLAACLAAVVAGSPPSAAQPTDPASFESQLTDAERRAVQQDLQRLGLYPGAIDGLFGSGTRNGIRAFQAAIGEAETGSLSADQRTLLRSVQSLADAGLDPAEDPGATLSTALDLGILSSTALAIRGRAGGDDAADMVAFVTDQPMSVQVTLTGLEADLEIELLDGDGNLIAISNNAGTAAERLVHDAGPGRHFVRIIPFGTAEGAYRLDIVSAGPAAFAAGRIIGLDPTEADWGQPGRLRVEAALDLLGYTPGAVDGRFERRTRLAIAAFQVAQGAPSTGRLSAGQRVDLAAAAAEVAAARGLLAAEEAQSAAASARSIAAGMPVSGDYQGEVRGRHIAHGLGVRSGENSRIEGMFRNGQPEGAAVEHQADGDVFAGMYHGGSWSGYGSFTKPDGRVWLGQVSDGRFDGFAVFTGATGLRVAGEWTRTEAGWNLTGFAEQTDVDGTIWRGLWDAGELAEAF